VRIGPRFEPGPDVDAWVDDIERYMVANVRQMPLHPDP